MIAIPARVSPPARSIPSHSLPASPVLTAAAPAVVIRQAAEKVAATPAVTIQCAVPAAKPRSPSHVHARSYAALYPPSTATVVATPAAIVHDPQQHRQQHSHSHLHHRHQQPSKLAVTAHTVEHTTHYVHEAAAAPHYCEHHAPVSYKQPQLAEHQAYMPIMYAQPQAPVSYPPTHLVYQQPPAAGPYHLVYEMPPPPVKHYPAASAPSHVCSHMDMSQYYASALLSVAVPQPSLSPSYKPQPTRMGSSVPSMSLTAGNGSAFTPVQPIAMYPRTGILIQ